MAATTASSFSLFSHINRARSRPQSTVQATVMLHSGFHGLQTRNLISKTAGSSVTQSLCKKSHEIELINGWKATTNPSYKVTIIGSPLGMGLALSTALKNCPSISQLQFYSIGGQDHLNACIDGTHSPELKGVLNGVDVVVICPVMPVEESALREDDFIANATIVKACIEAVAIHCPNAFIAISSRFLNSIIPMAAEILKKRAIYDPNKVFGLMTPEVELARAFVAERFVLDVEDVHVPVIGGHCYHTTIPLFSKTNPRVILYEEDRILWTSVIKFCVTKSSPHLDYFAGNPDREYFEVRGAERFVLSLLRAFDGAEDVFQCCFVDSKLTEVPFFGSTVKLGKKGIKSFIKTDLEGLTKDEAEELKYFKEDIIEDIEKGVKFANKTPEAY